MRPLPALLFTFALFAAFAVNSSAAPQKTLAGAVPFIVSDERNLYLADARDISRPRDGLLDFEFRTRNSVYVKNGAYHADGRLRSIAPTGLCLRLYAKKKDRHLFLLALLVMK